MSSTFAESATRRNSFVALLSCEWPSGASSAHPESTQLPAPRTVVYCKEALGARSQTTKSCIYFYLPLMKKAVVQRARVSGCFAEKQRYRTGGVRNSVPVGWETEDAITLERLRVVRADWWAARTTTQLVLYTISDPLYSVYVCYASFVKFSCFLFFFVRRRVRRC